MGIAKLVCDDCGAVVSSVDKYCPQCGTRLEISPETVLNSVGSPVARCPVCGAQVDARANFCESCGASLNAGNPRVANGNQVSQRNVIEKPQKAAKKPTVQRNKERQKLPRFEPWQLITGVVVLVLVGFFAYYQLSREPVSQKITTQENFPSQPAPSLQDIEAQQARVDASPKDGPAVLRLANMIHDAALHDSRLLTRAIKTYTEYLALKTGDSNARANAQVDMGICYFEMARADTANAQTLLSRAIQEMQAAFTSNPTHQPAAFNLGIVNLNAGNMEESTKWFQKTIEINPNSELGKRAQQMVEQHSPQSAPN